MVYFASLNFVPTLEFDVNTFISSMEYFIFFYQPVSSGVPGSNMMQNSMDPSRQQQAHSPYQCKHHYCIALHALFL